MPRVGELHGARMSQEAKNAAVVGSAHSISFPSESNLSANFPHLSKSLPRGASQELEALKRTQCYRSRSVLFHQGE